MKQDYFKVEYKNATLILKKNRGLQSPCIQCVLNKSRCGDVCLLAGHAYHVHSEIQYHGWKLFKRVTRYYWQQFKTIFFH